MNVEEIKIVGPTGNPAAVGAGNQADALRVTIADDSAQIVLLTDIEADLDSIDTKLSNQATSAKQDLLLAELQLKADLTETQPVSLASIPLATGAATSAKQDLLLAELQLKADLTETQPVSLASLPSLPAGTNNIGDVDVLSLPALPAGSNNIGTVYAATPNVLFKGRASTFRTLGRAGTAGQKILSIHNASGSLVTVNVTKVRIDMFQTVVKAVTVAPPIVRLWKVTVLPTNGTALTKNKTGGTTTSSASVTLLQDSSADGTGSGTTLTATLPAGTIVAQETAPRLITAAGYEVADKVMLVEAGESITLAPLEGLVVFLDYTLATQNPVTDMWFGTVEWTES